MRNQGFLRRRVMPWLLVVWASPLTVPGQVDRGTIVGAVYDTSGGVVPGAAVTVTNVETGQATSVNTDASGNYVVTLLRIGTYTLSAEKEGFQKTVQTNVVLGVNQVVRADLVLRVGAVTENVQVTAAPPLVESQTSSLGTIEADRRIVDLPLNGRNFMQLAFLGPGANQGASGNGALRGTTDNNRPGIALQVNGLDNFDNNFLLDGSTITSSGKVRSSSSPLRMQSKSSGSKKIR